MTSIDIVDRLMKRGRDEPDGDGWGWTFHPDPLCKEAADTIKALRAEVAAQAAPVAAQAAPAVAASPPGSPSMYVDSIREGGSASGKGHAPNCDGWHHPITGHCGDCGCITCSPER